MKLFKLTCLVALSMFAGCSDTPTGTAPADAVATESAAPSEAGAKLVLSTEPAEAKDVIAVREASKDGDEVVVVGRIGGSSDPWVEGTAAFTVVDLSLHPCADDEGCPTPWDYCCSTDKLPSATALVKVVDGDGKLMKEDARKLLGLKELQTVVVQGKASRDEAGNLTINASGLFVRK